MSQGCNQKFRLHIMIDIYINKESQRSWLTVKSSSYKEWFGLTFQIVGQSQQSRSTFNVES